MLPKLPVPGDKPAIAAAVPLKPPGPRGLPPHVMEYLEEFEAAYGWWLRCEEQAFLET